MSDIRFPTDTPDITPVGADRVLLSRTSASGAASDATLDSLPVSTATTTALAGKQPLDAGLTSISALTGTGYVKATATDTFSQVTTIPNTDITGLGTLSTQNGTFSGTSSGTNTGDQTITLTSDVTGSGTGSFATTIATGVVTLAKMANVATGTIFYRKTAATGAPEVQTLATLKTDLGLTGTNSGDQTITLTSDVTGTGTGSFATTIGTNVVTNAKAAQMPANTIKGNNTGSTANASDLTVAQTKTLLAITESDVSGLVSDLALKAPLASPTFTGTVTLPAGQVVNGVTLSTAQGTGNFLRGDGTYAAPSGTGDMILASAQTNSGLKTFLDGTLGLRNVANTFTSLFTNTNTAARTYTLKDASGTVAFTSDITGTNSGTNTGDVTLAGTPNYITIAGQVITRALIDLTTHITGRLPFANLTQGSARSILGVTGNATADVASIQGTADQVLAVNTAGTALAFGTVQTGGVANSAITLAKQADVATSTVFYRKTAGTGAPEVNTLATLKTDLGLTGTNSGDQTITLTGDATGSGTGSFAVTLANTAVTPASYTSANITVDSKGRITAASNGSGGGSSTLASLTDVNLTSLANGQILVYDSGTSKWLNQNLSGGGDMLKATYDPTNKVADAFNQDNMADGTTNKNYTATEKTKLAGIGAGADMVLASAQTNSGLKTFLDGTFGLRNVANTFTSLFTNTNTAARTYTLKDSNGTIAFTSDITGTNSGTNTGDVTLAGTPNYITIAGQVITRALIDLTTHVTGLLPFANIANVATSTVMYRKTAGTGAIEAQTLATLKTDLGLTGTNSGDQTITLTGGVTGSGTGSFAATVVTNANMTGDVTSVGNATTLATVNSNVGSFGLAGSVAQFVVNAKGLITSAANVAISITASQVSDFSAGVRAVTLTGLSLATSQVIAATDTVLLALGYLQAQITALTTTVSGKASTSTTISTTAPLSGGGDLSANRTLTTSMSTNKLIGRGTAGTGVMEEITLGTNLSLTGTTLNATGGGGAGIAQQQSITSTGQTVFNLSFSYTVGDKGLSVFINGVRQTITTHYTESSTTQVTFTSTVTSGNVVDFVYGVGVGATGATGGTITLVKGASTLNFGSTPGTSLAVTTITGQTAILSTSNVKAYLVGIATATHNIYEHMVVPLTITCGGIVVGTGFDIYASSPQRLNGTFNIVWEFTN